MPVPALGGRFTEFREAELAEAPVPAQGGRLLELVRGVAVEFAGRFVLPKPCGARPESVLLPCAFQVRADEFARADEFTEADGLEPCAPAEGGRLAESCAWRPAFIAAVVLPGLRPELFMVRTG